MWPKMLFEILPHIGRLVPVAEKFFATRNARDAEEQATLTDIRDTLRTELNHVSEIHTSLQQAVTAQREQIDAANAQITRVRLGVEAIETRVTRLEASFVTATEAAERADRSATRAARLFVVVVVLLAAIILMLVFLLLRAPAH